MYCFTQHALWPQVYCRRSLTSKIFESSQSVMKQTSASLGVSWKVGGFCNHSILMGSSESDDLTASIISSRSLYLWLRWASVFLNSAAWRSEDHTPPHQSLQRAAAGKTSSPSPPTTSNANTTREYWGCLALKVLLYAWRLPVQQTHSCVLTCPPT